ncbi:YkgJ family cysteine cluster protein [Desulforamulus ruminis]|uniref:Zinc-or iron-chelating domain-containing protein n=1 Tax=Desulforamulus ruminis (strain ATCC 23193 / DSM 2154 / NCIMB 8452 / DL) TaxID=696281 RepID=F6DQL2_DESRL|nr:YkgJ family cysteine cluster protein [Desulforamulus ruminis]AEG62009.1 protein of unknown function UPF0153 [Desulforamulus ruminis DSM 2154]
MAGRLPLDYSYLFYQWNEFTDKVRSGQNIFPQSWSSSLWQEKLHLLHNIITNHPDSGLCSRCGECCLDFPFACRPVEFFYILPYIALQWPKDRQQTLFLEQMGKIRDDGQNYCPFLEKGGCSIYPVRPLLCRRAICGEHICNKQNRDFDSLGDWCNADPVITQLTTMNLVYYYFDEQNQSIELNWPVELPGLKSFSLTVAPFEIWLLLLLDQRELCAGVLELKTFKPILQCLKPGTLSLGTA